MNLLEEEKNHPKFQMFYQEGILDLSEETEPIKEKEYWDFQTIQKVIFGPNIQEIGSLAFIHCRNLQEVDFNGTCITHIPISCFINTSLKSIVLPSPISVIEDFSFSNCINLSSIVLLGVKQINFYAFGDCPKLTNIKISNEIEYIHVRAFERSGHRNSITITCPQRFEEYFLERFPNATFVRNE